MQTMNITENTYKTVTETDHEFFHGEMLNLHAGIDYTINYYEDAIDPQTLAGSISVGTLKQEDILYAIKDFLEWSFPEKMERFHNRVYLLQEDIDWLYNELYEIMEQIAAETGVLYFGGHVGDPADIGFWFTEDMTAEEIEELLQ